jgi:spermidine/putrescine transport system ATP-binding protein
MDAAGGLSIGEKVEIFVRPEAVRLSRNGADVAGLGNAGQGRVETVLFNGANSQLILRDEQTGAEMSVALPQTGEFRDLSRGDLIHFGWEHQQTRVYGATGGQNGN